jgi:hypothetical protein
MHPLRSTVAMAEEELRHDVPGANGVMDAWTNYEGEKLGEARLEQYAELVALAKQRATFAPLEMPDARRPPEGELVLAWALHRSGAPLAVFPECAVVNGDSIELGGAGSSTTCTVYQGPMALRGEVRIRGTVVVVGHLTIEGTLTDGWAADSALVVIGNETVRAMNAGSDHLVTGDFKADLLHVVSEETSFFCGGTATARALISRHWSAQAQMPFVVSPDELQPLRAKLLPRPGEEVSLEALVAGVGAGAWSLHD